MDKQKLYIMKNSFGLIKIGISNDPERRANDLRLASGVKVDVLKEVFCPDAFKLEQWLHKQFKEYRKEGEWFTDISVSSIVKKMCLHESFNIPVADVSTIKILPCFSEDTLTRVLETYYKNNDSCGYKWSYPKTLKELLGFSPMKTTKVRGSMSHILEEVSDYFSDPYLVTSKQMDYYPSSVIRLRDYLGKVIDDFEDYIFIPNKRAAIDFQKSKLLGDIEGYEKGILRLRKELKDKFQGENL